MTSSESFTPGSVPSSLVSRSMFTWVVITSEMASTIHRTGSIIPWA